MQQFLENVSNKSCVKFDYNNDDRLLLESWFTSTHESKCIINKYKKKGVISLFPWQSDCLTLGNVLEGENIVYSAPTSAGKTLVAELLMYKRTSEKNKRALYILPFVSVAREKMFHLENLFEDTSIKVGGFMSTHSHSSGFSGVNIAVCTIEKANNLVNRLLEERTLTEQLCTVIVDELHMVGDSSRGYQLELLLSKILYISKENIQIIGLSATLPNLSTLANWLNAQLYTTTFRPVPLYERICCNSIVYNSNGDECYKIPCLTKCNNDDITIQRISEICQQTANDGGGVLIFCQTKKNCENLAMKLSRFFNIPENFKNNLLEVLEQLKRTPAGLDNILEQTIMSAIAFHHAGLTMDERDVIESSFRNGNLKIIVATSTLSSGVNMPARRVIIRSPFSFGNKPLDISVYKQMSGRAGRKGVDEIGESLIFCKESEKKIGLHLLRGDLEPVKSCLQTIGDSLSDSLKQAILEVIASRMINNIDDIMSYLSCTLLGSCLNSNKETNLQEYIDFLVKYEFITFSNDKKNVNPTQLGCAAINSGIKISNCIRIFSEIETARRSIDLESDYHIIYQLTPVYSFETWTPDWIELSTLIYSLSESGQRAAKLCGINHGFITRMLRGGFNRTAKRDNELLFIHKRFYAALALKDLIDERKITYVANKFKVSKGDVQNLQQSAATFAGQLCIFCDKLGWNLIKSLFEEFLPRLTFGIQRELIYLAKIDGITAERARYFFNKGYETVASIAHASNEDVERVLREAKPFSSVNNEIKTIVIEGLPRALNEAEAASYFIKGARKIIMEELNKLGMETNNIEFGSKQNIKCLKDCDNRKEISYSNNNLTTEPKMNEEPIDNNIEINSDNLNSLIVKRKMFESPNVVDKKKVKPRIVTPQNSSLDMSWSIGDSALIDINLNTSDKQIRKHNNEKSVELFSNGSIDFAIQNYQTPTKIITNKVEIDENNVLELTDDFSRVGISFLDESDTYCSFLASTPNRYHSNIGSPHSDTIPSTQQQEREEFWDSIHTFTKSYKTPEDKSFRIIDVCENRQLFDRFFNEWKTINSYSLSVACSKNENFHVDERLKCIDDKNVSIIGLAICWDVEEYVCFFIGFYDTNETTLDKNISIEEKLKRICEIFAIHNQSVIQMAFDLKAHMRLLSNTLGCLLNGRLRAIEIAWWLLDPSSKRLDFRRLVNNYASDLTQFLFLIGGGPTTETSIGLTPLTGNPDASRLRSCMESLVVFRAMPKFFSLLKNMNLLDLYENIEMPVLKVLTEQELNGIGYSPSLSNRQIALLKEKLIELENKAYVYAGHTFSLSTATDIAQVLYFELKLGENHRRKTRQKKTLGVHRRSKNVNFSTAKDVLEKFKDEHEIVGVILAWRRLDKAISTVSSRDFLRDCKRAEMKRIFSLAYTHTETGRVTIEQPSLQNVQKSCDILINEASGETISINPRSLYVAFYDGVLVAADYSQLELRIMSHLSGDSKLIEIFNSKSVDAFKLIASKWFKKVNVNDVTKEERQTAKEICYGISYGMSAKGLAEKLKIDEAKADEFIKGFECEYYELKHFLKRTVQRCQEFGYAETMYGRRRYLPNINSSDNSLKSRAERQAVNTTIQGSAADIFKRALLRIDNEIKKRFIDSRIPLSHKQVINRRPTGPFFVLHLHDEIIYECHRTASRKLAEIIQREMSNVPDISVRLPVTIKIGPSWGDLIAYEF